MKVLLVVYDNDSFVHTYPLSVSYIATAILNHGHEVTIYNQDKEHYPDAHLTKYLDDNHFDVVGISVIAGYYQYRKLLKLSDAINKSIHRPFYIIGGHGPSPEPEFFLKKTYADAAVIGEGEITIIELLTAVANHRTLDGIKGIAYWNGNQVIINEKRPLIVDIDTIPMPNHSLFPIEYYRLRRDPLVSNRDFVMDVISGRGCTFECNFCYRLDKGFRPRSNASIIDEVRFLNKNYAITYVAFQDELLMSSVERTVLLCEDFIRSGLNIKWSCNGRLNYAKIDLLKLMKRAGCVFINYGIEAMDDEILRNMKKGLRVEQIIVGIENTLKVGISPGLNIIFGNIGENIETLNKGVEFLLKYDDGAQMRTIRPVTPYPGSPLYYYAIEQGLLKDCEDFYENKHLNSDLLAINFTSMNDEEFYRALLEANNRLITNYFNKKLDLVLNQSQKLYMERDTSFRGFRQT
ncbi:MAG: radical SAM protein [Nitrospirae bacterium]|nr:radical SAM protein [Nitrospirota bacterium]